MPDTYTDDIERAPRYRCVCKYPDCPQCNPEPEEDDDMPEQTQAEILDEVSQSMDRDFWFFRDGPKK